MNTVQMSDVPPVGWIYAMTNPSMPGLTKVGMTTRVPEARLFEANTSGTWGPPTPYTIEFAKKVLNPLQKEKALHAVMKKERINPRREFFSISPEEVLKLFDLIDGKMWVETVIDETLCVELDVASDTREVNDTFEKIDKILAKAANKLQVFQRFCSILGLEEDLATPRTWTEAEWQGLIPAFNELWDPADPESLTVLGHGRAVFGIQDYRPMIADADIDDWNLFCDVRSVLSHGGCSRLTRAQVDVASSIVLFDFWRVDFQAFRRKKMKELEVDFPEAQSRQKEVGRLWALEKEAKGISPTKTVTAYEYRLRV